jgi:hypothetical protein
MPPVNVPPALQQFVDDELMRAPLLVDQTLEGAVERMKEAVPNMSPHERAMAADLMTKVMSNRHHVSDYYLGSLKKQVAADLQRGGPLTLEAKPEGKGGLSLALVDEDEVAVDVEISHTIEAIRSVAEYELRELQTFTAALVGDMEVSRDHNPFRPETHARALWAAAQALPLSRGFQLAFMRHAAMPLAQVLRKTFAAASSRLEGMGIEPASHRTMILPSGSRRSRVNPEASFRPDLGRIRDSMPVPLDMAMPSSPAAREPLEQVLAQTAAQTRSLPPEVDPSEHQPLRDAQRAKLVESATSKVDQQSIELLSRLFDAVLSDRALAPDIRLLLSRLQAPALRAALREPKSLDSPEHPVWQLADRIAFFGEILPTTGSAERERVLRYVQGLVDHLVGEADQTAALYQWALERLQQHEQQRLERRCAEVAREITQLQQMEDKLAASGATPSTLQGTLDISQMDTVPAELIDAQPAQKKPAGEAQAWLREQRPGAWVRLFLQGRWVHAQLLWPGERGELYLFGHGMSDTTWAVRRNALLTLHAEYLLDTLAPRSLVSAAAKRVMRQMVR